MLCRWYWPRFGGRVNCFLISAEEYLLILSTNARRSELGSVAMARPRPVGLQGRRVRTAGTRGAAEPLQRMPSETLASSVSRRWKLPHFHLQR